MQEEQNIEGFLQNWIRNVVLFSHVIHHVQETCGVGSTPERNQRMTKGSRSSVAEVGGRGNKFSTLANSVRHTGWARSAAEPSTQVRCSRSKGCRFTNQSVYLFVNHRQGFWISFGIQLLALWSVQFAVP